MIFRLIRGLAISICLLIACAVAVAAQDAGQVLRLSVGYNSLYNTLKDSPKKDEAMLAKVESLGKAAREARQAGKHGEALKHYYHAIALMRGTEWTPERALATALTLKPERAMLEPDQTVSVRVGQLFQLDEKPQGKLAVSLALLRARGDEPVAVLKLLDSFDLGAPLVADVTIPSVENGTYRLAIILKPAAQSPSSAGAAPGPIIKAATIRVERGLPRRVAAAKARAEGVASGLKGSKQPLAHELASAQYRIGLFDLASAGEIAPERVDFD